MFLLEIVFYLVCMILLIPIVSLVLGLLLGMLNVPTGVLTGIITASVLWFGSYAFWDVGNGIKQGVQTGIINYAGEQGIIFRTFEVEMVSSTGATKTYEYSVISDEVRDKIIDAVNSGKPVKIVYHSSWKQPYADAKTNHIITSVEYLEE